MRNRSIEAAQKIDQKDTHSQAGTPTKTTSGSAVQRRFKDNPLIVVQAKTQAWHRLFKYRFPCNQEGERDVAKPYRHVQGETAPHEKFRNSLTGSIGSLFWSKQASKIDRTPMRLPVLSGMSCVLVSIGETHETRLAWKKSQNGHETNSNNTQVADGTVVKWFSPSLQGSREVRCPRPRPRTPSSQPDLLPEPPLSHDPRRSRSSPSRFDCSCRNATIKKREGV